MKDSAAEHHEAAARHEMAADNHERAARFWQERGDRDRAALQREMAEYERQGAALERRWARIVDPEGALTTRRASELMLGRTREGARALAQKLAMAADALETSADLADEHANRHRASGEPRGTAEELQAAERTREAARRARVEAEKWLRASERPE